MKQLTITGRKKSFKAHGVSFSKKKDYFVYFYPGKYNALDFFIPQIAIRCVAMQQ